MLAVVAILTTRTYRAAAKAAGVGERTLRRWRREDPDFRAFLRGARRAQREAAIRGAVGAAFGASEFLSKVALLRVPDDLEKLPPGALTAALWPPLRAAERSLEIAGLLEPKHREADEVRRLRGDVAALERRVRDLEVRR